METLVKIGLAIALVVGLVLGFEHWKHGIEEAHDKIGYDRANAAWAIKEAGIKEEAEAKWAGKVAEANQATADLQGKFDASEVTRVKENKDAQQKADRRVADALAGTSGLSIGTGTTCHSVPGVAEGQSPTAPAGVAGETRADLLPTVAAAFERIAADTAGFVRDYNRVVDLYSAAASTCNSP